jgi:hypothetical protein
MYVCVRQVNASVGMTGIGVRNASAWSCTETTTGIIERGALCLPAHGGRQPIQTLIRRLAWCLVLQLRAGLACSQHRRRAVTAAIPSATKAPWPCRGHRHQRHRPGERDGHCAHRQREAAGSWGAGGAPKKPPPPLPRPGLGVPVAALPDVPAAESQTGDALIVVDGGRVGSSEGDAVYMMIMSIHVVYAVLVYTFHC